MNDEIREAVEALNTLTRSRMAGRKTLQPLVDLATAYLSIEGWPEEKKLFTIPCHHQGGKITDEVLHKEDIGFNDCLHLCKLAFLAKYEGLLHNDITPELVEKHFPKGECKERGQAIVLHAEMLIAIKSHLLGGSK